MLKQHSLELAKGAVGLEHLTETQQATHLAFVADGVFGETVQSTQQAVSVHGHSHCQWALTRGTDVGP